VLALFADRPQDKKQQQMKRLALALILFASPAFAQDPACRAPLVVALSSLGNMVAQSDGGRLVSLIDPEEIRVYVEKINEAPPPLESKVESLFFLIPPGGSKVLVIVSRDEMMCEQFLISQELHRAAMLKARGREV
jgi:hypothetical protein